METTTASDWSNTTDAMELTCERSYTENNQTHVIIGGYQGIPQNLLINVIVWAVLLLLFSVMRKIAWDYGRIALVSRTEASALQPTENARYNVQVESHDSPYNVWTSLFYGDHGDDTGSQESLDTRMHQQDKGLCSWILAFFKIKDEHILQKSGKDAVQYLHFQRYLIVYMVIITILSIGVILPCNFQGELEGDKNSFGHTTISNVNAESKILWVHTLFAVLYLIIAMLFMRHFSISVSQADYTEEVSRTLMVTNINSKSCSKNLILQHFQEAYSIEVFDVKFAYDISELAELDDKRKKANEGLKYSEQISADTGERPLMTPVLCGECCCDCCHCKKVDCIEYYSKREERYRKACDEEKVWAFRRTLGIAFITFKNEGVAHNVRDDFAMSCKGGNHPNASSVSKMLNVDNWNVQYAPHPEDIYWQNLTKKLWLWWGRAVCVNMLLFFFFLFLTTPSIILNLLSVTNYEEVISAHTNNTFIVQFIPTLLLWIVAALLPQLVFYVETYCVKHWTRTTEHHNIMLKTFYLLLLMVLVLPSLGLTSAWALLEWVNMKNEDSYKFRWKCIFIPDNGAFFVNYVITAAFIGTAVELVRIPQLLLYAIKVACAKSAAERTSVRRSVLYEFMYGCNYAWMLSIFTVTMVYSIPCPLITPFGLVYVVLKHLVDRYNIFFAYKKSKIDQNIHGTAVNFVIIAVILLQAFVLFFIILRATTLHNMIVFLMISFILTLIILVGRCCCGWFSWLSPMSYKKITSAMPAFSEATAFETAFVPNVLKDMQNGSEVEIRSGTSPSASSTLRTSPSYGSVGNSEPANQLSELPPGGDSYAP